MMGSKKVGGSSKLFKKIDFLFFLMVKHHG
jgi:hypothetical protein